MKKTVYYNFIPTKAEEEAAVASGIPYQTTRSLVEITDSSPLPHELKNPWKIKKVLSCNEVMTGLISLLENDMFNYVFRHWTLDMANKVVLDFKKHHVTLWDVTEENNSKSYGKKIYVENGPGDTYLIGGCMNLFQDRGINPGDEIGLFWEPGLPSFQFKVIRRGNI